MAAEQRPPGARSQLGSARMGLEQGEGLEDLCHSVIRAVQHLHAAYEDQVAELRGEVTRLQLLAGGNGHGDSGPIPQPHPAKHLEFLSCKELEPAPVEKKEEERCLTKHGFLQQPPSERFHRAVSLGEYSVGTPDCNEVEGSLLEGKRRPSSMPRPPETQRALEDKAQLNFGLPSPPCGFPQLDFPDVVCHANSVEIKVPLGGQNNASKTLRAAFQAIRAADYWSEQARHQQRRAPEDVVLSAGVIAPEETEQLCEPALEILPESLTHSETEQVKAWPHQAKSVQLSSKGSRGLSNNGADASVVYASTESSVQKAEDPRTWFQRIATSRFWEVVYAVLVIWDLITVSFEVEWFLTKGPATATAGEHRLLASSSGSGGGAAEFTWNSTYYSSSLKVYLIAAENVLTSLFLLDTAIRFGLRGWRGYIPTDQKKLSNLTDVILTAVTNVLFVWILPIAGVDTLTNNTILCLKCFRFVRVQRVVNSIMENRELFKEMSLIIRGLSVSGRSFVSSIAFITFTTYVFAIIGCVTLVPTIQHMAEEAQDETAQAQLETLLHHLGHVDSFMLALAEFASKNPNILPPILKYVKNAWMLFYTYAAFLDLVLLNMIEAVAVENALANSEVQEQQKLLHSLNELFVLMDENGDGTLSWQEFKSAFSDQEISKKWKLLDIDKSECKELFSLLDPGDGNIPMNDFFEGISRMKGQALSKDVFRMMKTLDDLVQAISVMFTVTKAGGESHSESKSFSEASSFFSKPNLRRKSSQVFGRMESPPAIQNLYHSPGQASLSFCSDEHSEGQDPDRSPKSK